MHELCMHCDHEKNTKRTTNSARKTQREQRNLYDRTPAQFVELVQGPKQAESKICTELRTSENALPDWESDQREGKKSEREKTENKKKAKKKREKKT